MKNTKRKSIMLLPESWEILKNVQEQTNLNASEIINEILMMYWSRWTNHRKKRLEPYKKTPATRTPEPKLDENVQDPQQDSTDWDKALLDEIDQREKMTPEELDKLINEVCGDD